MIAVVAIPIGLTTGVISGLIGLGGGVFVVPALVYVFKMSQHAAQGTSLPTLLLPLVVVARRIWFAVDAHQATGGVERRRLDQRSREPEAGAPIAKGAKRVTSAL
jgi:Sulfite exporter TauE/SafE